MESKYKDLLSPTRFRTSSVTDRNILLEAESDRGRLLFCAAFRRLQQKAQVFSMEPNAAVRSRLTHSLEVSQMGRYIADQISFKLIENKWATSEECAALTTFVETACLMHDIGNPPFGHFGESAISEWFRTKGAEVVKKSCGRGTTTNKPNFEDTQIENALVDFFEFDGNPQGIRVVTKLQRNSDEHGLNLTKTTIASYLKYVKASGLQTETTKSPFTKKCGFFSTEADIVSSVWQEFNYNIPQRFPLAYIMEAADDIAYCISDLEDSIEKGLLDQKIAMTDIHEKWIQLKLPQDFVADRINQILENAACGKKADETPFTYIDFRTSLNRELVLYSAEQYISAHSQILDGSLRSLIPQESPAGRILDILKSYCREKVYCHESVQRIELAGYRAIYGLLDHFSCLLEASASRFNHALTYATKKDDNGKPIIIENKLLTLFPKNYIKVYHDQLKNIDTSDENYELLEWNLRAHLITDFLSGMTDDFAMKTYQMLSGMKS